MRRAIGTLALMAAACQSPGGPTPVAPPAPTVERASPPRTSTSTSTSTAVRPRWPQPGALTSTLAAVVPARRRRIALDAGHGAPGNSGARSRTCQEEQDFTLQVTRALAERLAERADVIETRPAGTSPAYADRVAHALRERAEVLISLHFDVRGEAYAIAGPDGRACWASDGSAGFSVLWSDEGAAPLVARRQQLARALAGAMARRGFGAYDGVDYPGLYDGDPTAPGVFVDRHLPNKRVFMLRRPTLPTVILETHHALHADDWARWQEPATLDAAAEAILEALDSL